MPYSTAWCAGKRVVYLRYSGEVSLEDFAGVGAALSDYIEKGDGPLVHDIVDFTDSESIPKSAGQGQRSLKHLGNPKFGWAVIVTADKPAVVMLTSLMAKSAKQRYHAVSTRDEAVAFLKDRDVTLDGLEWSFPE